MPERKDKLPIKAIRLTESFLKAAEGSHKIVKLCPPCSERKQLSTSIAYSAKINFKKKYEMNKHLDQNKTI